MTIPSGSGTEFWDRRIADLRRRKNRGCDTGPAFTSSLQECQLTVIDFPAKPSPQAVFATTARLSSRFPAWALSVDVSEDGMPSVAIAHRLSGGEMSAHWNRQGWAVLAEDFTPVVRSVSLEDALEQTLG